MEIDPVLKSEFGDTNWICPDPESKQFEILNYPNLFTRGNGLSFNMVINTCDEAKKINEKQGFADYETTAECFSDSDTDFESVASHLTFRSKVLTQSPLDPEAYEDS